LQRPLEIRVRDLNGPKETARPTPLALRHQNHAVTFLLNVDLGSFEPELFRQPDSLRTSAPEKFGHFHVDTVYTDQTASRSLMPTLRPPGFEDIPKSELPGVV
jgi:hypothetical protein